MSPSLKSSVLKSFKGSFLTIKILKATKYEIQKPSTCRAILFRCNFWSMFRVFHLAWSTWSATETLVAGRKNAAHWLDSLPEREKICRTPSCQFDEKRATKPKFVAQSKPALYFSKQLSSTRNKCSCCATSWLRTVKNGKHRPKLATKQCCTPSWGVFVSHISPPLAASLSVALRQSNVRIFFPVSLTGWWRIIWCCVQSQRVTCLTWHIVVQRRERS